MNKGFTFNLKIDYMHDPSSDELLKKNPKEFTPGSHWQASVSIIVDAQGKVLNMQSAYAIDELVKSGGLEKLLQRVARDLPRLLDQNGLVSK